jgi:hypothetical protein
LFCIAVQLFIWIALEQYRSCKTKIGSCRESVKVCVLRGFLDFRRLMGFGTLATEVGRRQVFGRSRESQWPVVGSRSFPGMAGTVENTELSHSMMVDDLF